MKSLLKKALIFLFLPIVVIVAIVLFNTVSNRSSIDADLLAPELEPALLEVTAQKLSTVISYKTISFEVGLDPDPAATAAEFDAFRAALVTLFPLVHETLERTILPDGSLIYRWAGRDPEQAPIGLSAHFDVVTIEAGTETDWQYPPFSGQIVEGRIWGRGTLDDKGSLIAIMEAAERLIAQDYIPPQDVYFLFGHDEEIGGQNGAANIVRWLQKRSIEMAWVLDEGSLIFEGLIPGYDGAVAFISLGEKGYTTLKFTAESEGGHSSAPSPDTAASIIARATARITDEPYPLKMDHVLSSMLHKIAPELPFMQKLVLSNLWLTKSVVGSQLSKNNLFAAAMHTTTAVTVLRAGEKGNILPQHAYALVNYRNHVRNSPDDVIDRAKRIIDDPRVNIEALQAYPASALSSEDSVGYQRISTSIVAAHGSLVIVPSLTIAGTDSRHYAKVAKDAYRFSPFVLGADDFKQIHGTNEHISMENMARAVLFYEDLLKAE